MDLDLREYQMIQIQSEFRTPEAFRDGLTGCAELQPDRTETLPTARTGAHPPYDASPTQTLKWEKKDEIRSPGLIYPE